VELTAKSEKERVRKWRLCGPNDYLKLEKRVSDPPSSEMASGAAKVGVWRLTTVSRVR
jgi:hypothetical protein